LVSTLTRDFGRVREPGASAELLGASHDYRAFPHRRPNRWSNRSGGNGRIAGYGVIRLFGETVHMQLRAPASVNRCFSNRVEALAYLATLCAANNAHPAVLDVAAQ
jgi:hypothetical protein